MKHFGILIFHAADRLDDMTKPLPLYGHNGPPHDQPDFLAASRRGEAIRSMAFATSRYRRLYPPYSRSPLSFPAFTFRRVQHPLSSPLSPSDWSGLYHCRSRTKGSYYIRTMEEASCPTMMPVARHTPKPTLHGSETHMFQTKTPVTRDESATLVRVLDKACPSVEHPWL